MVIRTLLTVGLWTGMLLPCAASIAVAGEMPVIHTIATASDVGDEFKVRHIGFMAFSNKDESINVGEWKLDEYIKSELEKGLSSSYQLHKAKYERGTIAPAVDDFFWSAPNPGDNIRTHASTEDGQPVDAYVVVWPYKHDVYPTNQFIQGIGLLTWGPSADLFTAIMVSVVDAKPSKTIGQCVPHAPDDEQGRERDTWKHKEFNFEQASDVTAEQVPLLETATKQVLHAGIAFCLRELKLVP